MTASWPCLGHCVANHVTIMKVCVILALLVACALAQDYSYVSYFSDNKCSEFRGSRVAYEDPTAWVGGSAFSCGHELACLVEPTSPQCAEAHNGVTGTVNAQTLSRDRVSVQVDADNRINYSPDQCVKSSFYENCWFNVLSKENYEEKVADSCRAQFSHSEITGDDDDSTNDYAYMTFYSDDDCTGDAFEGQVMVGPSPSIFTSREASDCATEIACAFGISGSVCQGLTGDQRQASIRVEVNEKNRYTYEYLDGTRRRYTSDNCQRHPIYTKCHYRYFTADEMETYSDGCDDKSGFSAPPSVSLGSSRDRSRFSGATWFLGSTKTASPFEQSPISTLSVSAAPAVCASILVAAAVMLALVF